MFFRFSRFAFELAGRLPWLAFLITRCGLAMFSISPKNIRCRAGSTRFPQVLSGIRVPKNPFPPYASPKNQSATPRLGVGACADYRKLIEKGVIGKALLRGLTHR